VALLAVTVPWGSERSGGSLETEPEKAEWHRGKHRPPGRNSLCRQGLAQQSNCRMS